MIYKMTTPTNQPTNQLTVYNVANHPTNAIERFFFLLDVRDIFDLSAIQYNTRNYYKKEEEKEYNQLIKQQKAIKKQYKQELATMKFTAYNYISVVLENEGQTMRNKTDLIIDSFFGIINETKETKQQTILSKEQNKIFKMNKERYNILFNFVMKTNQIKSNKTCMICCEEFKLYELKKGCNRCSALLHNDCLQKYNNSINHHNCKDKDKINLHNLCIEGHDIIDHCPQCRIISDFKII